MYREHRCKFTPCHFGNGLSLCIQGTLNHDATRLFPTRFIPVYTGNILHISPRLKPISVYPCVYREHDLRLSGASFGAGLSLCIQGTCLTVKKTHMVPRFIPVYTGNILTVLSTSSNFAVYPCVYREHA